MPPIKVTAAVHPILKDRHEALTAALFAIWAELGVEVEVVTTDMKSYLDAQARGNADLLIGRWMADYDDPDDFTYALFHSAGGHMRTFFSSPETDRLAEEARMESRPAVREALYRKFENVLLDAGVLVPLFHDVDYRIAAAGVRGLALRSSPPFVNYPEIGKSETGGSPRGPRLGRRRHPRPDRRRLERLRPRHDGDPRAGRDDAARLRDAHAGPRGRPRRPVARVGSDSRGRGRALPLPPPAGRALPRRTGGLGARRPLHVRARPPGGYERRPVPPRPDPRRPGPHRREGLGSRGLPHRQPFGVRHRAGEAAVVLPGPRVVPRRGHRARGHDRDRRQLAEGLHRDGAVPPGGLRAGQEARARAEPRLLARRLPEERRRRLPLRRAARRDPQRVPRGPVLDRVGPPSRRRRGAAPGPSLPRDVPREPEPRDLFRDVQHPQGAVRGRAGAPGGRPGHRRRGDRPADARPARDSGERPHPAGTPRLRGEAEEPAAGFGAGFRRPYRVPRDRRGHGDGESHPVRRVLRASRRSSCRHFARWVIPSAS